ncbi:hypothetical protein BH11PSE4_BH11PSE4_03890 [soil metagenome]
MSPKHLCLIGALVASASPAMAASSFQNTCSQIMFAYAADGSPSIQAVCLRADGTPHQTSLALKGISNNNGKLVAAGGPASFQQSCGNILIAVTTADATLTAFCRTVSGSFNATSFPLDNISNQNGNLTQ